jgi:hypothetical protein
MPSRQENMTKIKSKIEGKHHSRRPATNARPARKEFLTKVLGLKSHTFDFGNTKYAAKYQKQWTLLLTTSRRSTREDQRLQGNQRLESAYNWNPGVPETILDDNRNQPRRRISVAAGSHQGKEENCASCQE